LLNQLRGGKEGDERVVRQGHHKSIYGSEKKNPKGSEGPRGGLKECFRKRGSEIVPKGCPTGGRGAIDSTIGTADELVQIDLQIFGVGGLFTEGLKTGQIRRGLPIKAG